MEQQNRQKFSESFKHKVAQEVLRGKLTKESARRIYGIKGKSAITDWVRSYKSVKGSFTTNDVNLNPMTPEEYKQFEELKRKIALLEEQLSNETHRAGLYKTMIEIAEEQLNIPIRKKFGAKQLKNTKTK
jgi:transposase-like protein